MSKNKTYELMIKIAGKTDSSLKAACNTADKNLSSLKNTAKTVGKVVAGAAVAAAAAVGTVGVAAVKAAADYESQLSNVSTLLDGTADEVAARTSEIGDQILDVSNRTGVATSDLTDGMYQVISAFGDSADAASILETAAKSAAAGNATTTDSINLLSAVTKGYGDTSAAANQQVADMAFETVKLGQTTFPELAASMGSVTGAASTLGVSQEELFGGFATLTGVTGNAAEVSTQLSKLYEQMMDPTDAMTAAIKNAGYESAVAMVQSEGLGSVLDTLMDSVDGDSVAFYNLFGNVNAAKAATALAGAQADNYASKCAEMYESTGAANTAFERQTDNLNYNIQAIKTMGHNFLIQIGQKVLPYVKDLAEKALPVLQEKIPLVVDYVANKLIPAAVNAAKWIKEHKTLILALAGGVVSLVAVFKTLQTVNTVVTTFTSLKKVFTATKAAGGTMSKVLSITSVKFLLIAVAIAAAVAAGIWIYKNWDKIKAKATELGAKIAEVWGNIKAWVTGVVANLVDAFQNSFPLLSAYISGWWESISAAVENVKAIFTNIIDFIKNVFTGNWSGAWENIVNIFGNLFGLIVNLAKAPINGVISAINWVLEKINGISFDLPDWKILGEWAGKTMGFNFPMIPALASGGIATGPTLAQIGEGGEPEAVLPLSKLAALLEKWGNQSKESGSGNAKGDGDTIVWSPVFKFYGSVSKSDAEEAGRVSFAEFKRLYKQMKAEERRKNFNPA